MNIISFNVSTLNVEPVMKGSIKTCQHNPICLENIVVEKIAVRQKELGTTLVSELNQTYMLMKPENSEKLTKHFYSVMRIKMYTSYV